MTTLITGGAGYIGLHIASVLLAQQSDVVIADNFSNSQENAFDLLKSLQLSGNTYLCKGDATDRNFLKSIFDNYRIDNIIHLAGFKAVKESVEKPTEYYRNNIDSSLALLDTMQAHNVTKLIFSSSATVYGNAPIPYTEKMEIGHGIPHPYGQTKFMVEQILKDACVANPANQFTSLRYFNPIGAHPTGVLGESPLGIPNNLMPYIQQVASGKLDELNVFGNDYPTPDGTCLRDYIHVMDVAEAHVAAIGSLENGYKAYNIGTGRATSVLELIQAFERANSLSIPYAFESRRDGDLAEFYADVSLASKELNWKASRTIEEACRDSWNFTKHLMDKEL